MKKLIILGSTGSIGTQALCAAEKNGWRIAALAAGRNIGLLEEQARKYKPEIVSVFDETAAADLKIKLADTDIKVLLPQGTTGIWCLTPLSGLRGLNLPLPQ